MHLYQVRLIVVAAAGRVLGVFEMKIILASASPRRRELLIQAGLRFEVMPSTVEEQMRGNTPAEIVMSLAEQKAADVYEKAAGTEEDNFLVLGADTIVVCDGARLGKPKDEQDAVDMLCMLSGRSHEVYTGVCMLVCRNGRCRKHVFSQCTTVHMYPISEAQARWYVSTKEPMDKAGAYGIQGKGAVFVEKIEGDYNNVVGLPLAQLWQYLDRENILDVYGNEN